MRPVVTFFLFSFIALSMPAQAAVFDVNSTSTAPDVSPGDGICQTSFSASQCTLPAALDESNALAGVDTINLPANIYTRGGSITDAVIINGADTETTIIDGFVLDFFTVNTSQPVTISGLTIRNVSGTGSYGIFLGDNGKLTLSDVLIHDIDGAAIITSNSGIDQLTIENSRFEGNKGGGASTRWGGALYLQSTGNVVVRDTTIDGNSATFGGGIYLDGTSLTLIRSTVSNNSASAAINVNGGFGAGGILVSGGGSLSLINSTVSGNQAVSSGGGIVIDDGTVSLYNATITDNRADSDSNLAGSGGGIIATTAAFSTTNVLELRNSIIAKNFAALNQAIDCSSANLSITSFGYNLLGAGSDTDCLITPAAGDQFGTVFSIDPLLDSLQDNGGITRTHLLTVGSPALDAGNPGGCNDASAVLLGEDQRGAVRPLDGGIGSARCDIGSVEMYVLPVADAGSDQTVQFGETVILDGSESQAFTGIDSFSWTEKPAPSVGLNNSAGSIADFVAPSTPGDLEFELTITDNDTNTNTDSVVITINDPPVADPGLDRTAYAGEAVILDGSSSQDSDGSIESFSWEQTAGTTVTLNDAATSMASFSADAPIGDLLVFELTVIDDTGVQGTETVEITVTVNQAAIDAINGAVKSAKKYQKKSSIKKDKKSKKALGRARKHLAAALAFYQAGDSVNAQDQVAEAIKDLRKVKKLKSKIRRIINSLESIA